MPDGVWLCSIIVFLLCELACVLGAADVYMRCDVAAFCVVSLVDGVTLMRDKNFSTRRGDGQPLQGERVERRGSRVRQ